MRRILAGLIPLTLMVAGVTAAPAVAGLPPASLLGMQLNANAGTASTVCNPPGVSAPGRSGSATFNISGTADGTSHPGTFTAQGRVTLYANATADVSETSTINSPNGTVTGVKQVTAMPVSPNSYCQINPLPPEPGLNSLAVITSGVPYWATFYTTTGTYLDSGQSTVLLYTGFFGSVTGVPAFTQSFDTSTGVTQTTDTTPPSCTLTGVSNGPPKQIQITAQDSGSGLSSIEVNQSDNATVAVPPFVPGTTTAVMVTATKTDQTLASHIGLRVTDRAGNVTNCDPTIVSLQRTRLWPQRVTARNVPEAEAFVTFTNGSPGLRTVIVTVNGRVMDHARLGHRQTTTLDVAPAMHPGDANTITLIGTGKLGATATAVIHGS